MWLYRGIIYDAPMWALDVLWYVCVVGWCHAGWFCVATAPLPRAPSTLDDGRRLSFARAPTPTRSSASFARRRARRGRASAKPHAPRARDAARRDGDADDDHHHDVFVARGARRAVAERRRGRGDAGAMCVASVAARHVARGGDGAREREG